MSQQTLNYTIFDELNLERNPVGIKFTMKKPKGPDGYTVNLRGEGWAKLKFPTD